MLALRSPAIPPGGLALEPQRPREGGTGVVEERQERVALAGNYRAGAVPLDGIDSRPPMLGLKPFHQRLRMGIRHRYDRLTKGGEPVDEEDRQLRRAALL